MASRIRVSKTGGKKIRRAGTANNAEKAGVNSILLRDPIQDLHKRGKIGAGGNQQALIHNTRFTHSQRQSLALSIAEMQGNQVLQGVILRQQATAKTDEAGAEKSYGFDVEQFNRVFKVASDFYDQEDYRHAIIQFEKARQIPGVTDPGKSACLYNIGMANLKLERYNTAIIYFERDLSTGSEDKTNTQNQLSKAKRLAGIPEGSAKETEEKQEELNKPKGQGEDQEGTTGGAETSLPFDVKQFNRLFETAEANYVSGNYRQAIINYEAARQIPGVTQPGKAACLFNIAVSNMKLKRYNTAIIYLEQLLEIDPTNAAETEKKLKEAKRLAGIPEEEPASKGDTSKATAEGAEKAPGEGKLPPFGKKLDKKQGKEVHKLGKEFFIKGEYGKALNQFMRLWLGSDDEKVSEVSAYNMGLCFKNLKDYDKALEFFGYYAKWKGANQARVQEQIKIVKSLAGKVDKDEAEPGLAGEKTPAEKKDEGKESDQESKENCRKGFELYKQRKYEEALILFSNEWKKGPNEKVRQFSAYNMGICYMRLKQYKLALYYVKEYAAWGGADRKLAHSRILQINQLQKQETSQR
jgi:tetratricopeptide (TPR) repeat protein